MKITYFNYLYDLYGASIGSTIKAIELFRAFENLGHTVQIHWRKENETDEGNRVQKARTFLKQRLDRYLHEPNQIIRNLSYCREEYSILQNEKPDLLIARLESNVFSPPLLARHFHLPYVAEVDSPVMYELRHFNKHYYLPYRLLERMELDFILKADRAYCVSHQLKNHFVERGIPSDHLEVIPNGADITRFHPDKLNHSLRREVGLDSNMIIGFIGSFHYWHGVEQLTSLIDALLEKHKNIAFLLVGKGGPMRNRLQDYIHSRQLSDRVRMIEYVPHDQIPTLIHAMDIVLAPYPNLPFFYYSPVKIYEYMACGKPVISSKIGQIDEIIRHCENGMLCTPGDIQAFIRASDQLINDENLRVHLGENAYRSIKDHFTWHHRAEQLQKLLKTVSH